MHAVFFSIQIVGFKIVSFESFQENVINVYLYLFWTIRTTNSENFKIVSLIEFKNTIKLQ